MARKLDDRLLRTLAPAAGDERIEVSDALMPGLKFRKTNSGHGSFSVVYRLEGSSRQERITLGPYPRLSLADARSQAREVLNLAAQGVDPKAARRPKAEAVTFRALAELYLKSKGAKMKRPEQIRQKLTKDVFPAIGEVPAEKVSRHDVIAIIEAIEERGALVTASSVAAMVSSIYRWGIRRGKVEQNPAYMAPRPGKAKPGDRVLSEGELRTVWEKLLPYATGATRCSPLTALAVLSRLLLGQRTSEVVRMRRDCIECEDGRPKWWNLPGEITKNGRPHRLPIPDLWADHVWPILEELSGGEEWVFASPRKRGEPMHEMWVSAFTTRFSRQIGIRFSPRDLRRTWITLLASLGVSREDRMRLANHTDPHVHTVHYDRYDYDKEKVAAIRLLNAHLQHVLFGEGARVLRHPAAS
jgi:integrase